MLTTEKSSISKDQPPVERDLSKFLFEAIDASRQYAHRARTGAVQELVK